MSEIAKRYRRLPAEFVAKVSQVSPERWDSPSPREGWSARFGRVVRLRAAIESFGDALHQSGVCGPPVDVAAAADDQTRLLALLGRAV